MPLYVDPMTGKVIHFSRQLPVIFQKPSRREAEIALSAIIAKLDPATREDLAGSLSLLSRLIRM